MKYFSTFSGIGGFEKGIELAYESLSKTKRKQQGRYSDSMPIDGEQLLAPQCIGFSEIDNYAKQIYQKHFPNHISYGDITQINAKDLPDFDLLVGGFPCQSFSIAGKRGGFNDTRGTMFFEIARIIGEKRPRLLLLENVKGLLSHDQGRTFGTIIRTLDELGYDLQWQVLNSKNHGVPQNRERVFIVGHLRGIPRPEVFPFGEADRATDERLKQGDTEVASTLRSRYGNGSGSHIATGKIEFVGSINPVTRNGVEHQAHLSRAHKQPARVHDARGINPALSSGETQGRYHTLTADARIRRLTPTECERLQGFPDGWTEGVSDTQRYKCLGNAVTVNVIKDICERLV